MMRTGMEAVMFGKQWMLIAAVGPLSLIGCDRFKQSSATREESSQAATTAPAPIAGSVPTTVPGDETRSLSVIEENVSRSYDFPRARIHIDRDEKTAVLYSDEPKGAADPASPGNSYYLSIPLTDEFVQKLDGYRWQYKSPTIEHVDSLDGLFLEGQRYQVQPAEMLVEFHGDGPLVHVTIDGRFLKFDASKNEESGTVVQVKGIVSAVVDPNDTIISPASPASQ
jgi:hypothetical protein